MVENRGFILAALIGAAFLMLTVRTAWAADPPVVDAGPDATIAEGGTFAQSSSFTDADDNPAGDVWTATVDYNEGLGAETLSLNGDKTFVLSNVYEAAGTYTVTVVVDDGTDAVSDTVTVDVDTVPVVNAGDGDTIIQGGTFAGAGSFVDPDTDTWTATVDYDEGAGPQALSLTDKTFVLNNLYEVAGTFTVTVVVNDGSFQGSDTATVLVGAPPDVGAGGNETIDRNILITRNGSFTSSAAGPYSASVDWGEGDELEAVTLNPDNTFTISNTYENSGIYTVVVTVFDGIFNGTDTFTLDVVNTPPVVNAGPGGTINEGDEFSLVGAVGAAGSFTDPNGDPWTATVDYDNEEGEVALGLNPDKTFDLSHVYPNNRALPYEIVVTINDGEASDSDTALVTVNNVAPIVDAGPDATMDEGSLFSQTGSITDPGTETWSATVDYGDGGGPVPLTINPDQTFELSHTYADNNGVSTVTVFVDDGDDTDTDTVLVTVQNVAPAITFPNGMLVDENSAFTRPGSFTDPGADAWEATVDYGASAGPVPLTLNGDMTFDLSHTYTAAGAYTVEVVVTDDDGESDTVSFDVFIFFMSPMDPSLNHPPLASVTSSPPVLFQTFDQDIWGPVTGNGAVTYDLFKRQVWDESGGVSKFFTIAGRKAGGAVSAGTSGHFVVQGVTTGLEGTTGVDYNGTLTLTSPAVNSFLAGDAVAEGSGWQLHVAGSSVDAGETKGNLKVDLDLKINVFLNAEICLLVGCVKGGTGNVVFEIHPTLFDFAAAGTVTTFLPFQIFQDLFLPINADFGPISVQPATDSVNTGTGEVAVSGENIFSILSIDLDDVASRIPGVPPLGIGFSVLGVTISADLFDITHNLTFKATQNLIFDGDVLLKYEFDRPVTGVLGSTESVEVNGGGRVTSVTFRAGDGIKIIFPVGETDPIIVTRTAFLSNTQLHNNTGIVTTSDITMFALRAEFTVPGFTIFPAIGAFDWEHGVFPIGAVHWECHGFLCTSGHYHSHTHHFAGTPRIGFDGVSAIAGPVWNSGPQGVLSRTDVLANEQFPLGGFNIVTLVDGVLDPEVPPTADANGDAFGLYTVPEGLVIPVDGSGSFDVDLPAQTLTHEWDLDNDGVFETTGVSPNFTLGADGPRVFPITLEVCDPLNCDTSQAAITVTNVAPTVEAGANQVTIEGTPISLDPASFTDPGYDDATFGTEENFTATIDWGDGTVEAGVVSETPGSPGVLTVGTVSGSHIYGDNGTYTVEVCVSDDDSGTGCSSFDVQVNNVDPTLTLDTFGAISFAGGDAFLGRKGVEQAHHASAEDPGSDDLTFDWTFPPDTMTLSNTYFNDGVGPEPFPSSLGVFPFSAADSVAVTFGGPSVYSVEVTATDDDGGADSDGLPKLVTDNKECARSQEFWHDQFKGGEDDDDGDQQIDDATLQAYLNIVNFSSAVFSEEVPASTLAEARALLNDDDDDGAIGQTLAAWLNFASGTVLWDESVTVDPVLVLPFHQLIAEVEAILLDPFATHRDIEHANDLAEAVNEHDEDNPACDDDDGDRQTFEWWA